MAMQTTLAAPTTTGSSVELLDAQSGVSTRRLKKREIDRRCQRQARERTKSRIAYLEGLVEDFRRQDSSGQLATLMTQLKEVENDRNIMAKTLKDIQKAMDTHKPILSGPAEEMEDKTDGQTARVVYERPKTERSSSSLSPPNDDVYPQLRRGSTEERAGSIKNFDLARFSPAPSLPLQSQDHLFAPEVVPCRGEGTPTSHVLVKTKSVREPNPMPCNYAENWTATWQSCSCNSCHERQPGRRSVWQGNYWRFANEVLSERFEWGDDMVPESDALADDVPVRAILEGWDAVAQRGPLHPSWQILRRIDETLFAMCPNVERLAIMRAMHILLQFHTESTTERYERLPIWYMRRPSQKIAHSYAIDYFAWPGVRERFIFGEHNYCGNDFWTLFTTSFKILWPYEFRDCYTREVDTGLYKFSPTFDQRLADIKCWTMGPDIFRRYPELYSDMPTFNFIPQSPSLGHLLPRVQQRRKLLPPAPSPVSATASASRIEEEEEIKPVIRGSPFVPVGNQHVQIARPRQQQQQHAGQRRNQAPLQQEAVAGPSGPSVFSDVSLNTTTALDAFAYGALSEIDFATFYQDDSLNGYPHSVF